MTVPFDLHAYLLSVLVVAASYIVFGISAFGAALFTVPILSYLFPLDFVLPVCVLLDVSAACMLGARFSGDADRSELKWLAGFSLIGAVAGVTLLVSLPRSIVLVGIALFLLGYGLYVLRQGTPEIGLSQRWAPVAGFMGGAMGTLFGVGAPPYAIYLTRRIADTQKLRATLSTMVLLSTSMRAAVFATGGLMRADRLIAYAALVPFALLGVRIGMRIQRRISRVTLVRVISALLALIGASLLLRATLSS